jgi:hypothetical protein
MTVTANASSRRSRNGACACQACGESFTPTRSDGRYCSSPCRQKAYRRRVSALDGPKGSGPTQAHIRGGEELFRLTAETREALRRTIDRRRRERLAASEAADQELFADELVGA